MRKLFVVCLLLMFILFIATGEAQFQKGDKIALKSKSAGTYLTAHPLGLSYNGADTGFAQVFVIHEVITWRGKTVLRIKSYALTTIVALCPLFGFIPLPASHFPDILLPWAGADAFEVYDSTNDNRIEAGYIALLATTMDRPKHQVGPGLGYLRVEPGFLSRVMGDGTDRTKADHQFQLIRDPEVKITPIRRSTPDQDGSDEGKDDVLQYDADKDAAIVAFFDKIAKAGKENNVAALVGLLPVKALQEAADEIRGRMKNEQAKAGLAQLGITAEDMKLENEELMVKYLSSALKMARQSEEQGETKVEVLATKTDGNTAFAKVKYTRAGKSVEIEHKLVKEDGVWVIAEKFAVEHEIDADNKNDENNDNKDKDDEHQEE